MVWVVGWVGSLPLIHSASLPLFLLGVDVPLAILLSRPGLPPIGSLLAKKYSALPFELAHNTSAFSGI